MSEQTSKPVGKIAWFELPAEDTARARRFYGDLFGWQFQPPADEDYHIASEAGGAVYKAPAQDGPLVYFGTDDIAGAIDRVRSLGGQADDGQEIPGIGSYAHCTDTEGNPFGLYQDGQG